MIKEYVVYLILFYLFSGLLSCAYLDKKHNIFLAEENETAFLLFWGIAGVPFLIVFLTYNSIYKLCKVVKGNSHGENGEKEGQDN